MAFSWIWVCVAVVVLWAVLGQLDLHPQRLQRAREARQRKMDNEIAELMTEFNMAEPEARHIVEAHYHKQTIEAYEKYKVAHDENTSKSSW